VRTDVSNGFADSGAHGLVFAPNAVRRSAELVGLIDLRMETRGAGPTVRRSATTTVRYLGATPWILLILAGAPFAAMADDRSLSPADRAAQTLARMTESEKLALVHGRLGAPWGGHRKPDGAIGSAGFVAGAPRLGVPALQETDAELGIANPGDIRRGDGATAMPSNLALASTWNEALARRQGEAVANEARARGFNLLLGGAVNLVRDPRGGRDFEYFSEDPLLSGIMTGATVAGARSRHVLTTVKHFALNDQETNRAALDVRVDLAAARESDLLAFEIAIEHGHPGAVMCAYNLINGVHACENPWLLSAVLKGDWRYPGFVMSDWGAAHSTVAAALAGLDQESGAQLDARDFFGPPLAQAVAEGRALQSRLNDMARRILTSIYAAGLVDDPPHFDPTGPASAEQTALEIEREGAVLLRNQGLLPLAAETRSIAVIGARADAGTLAGGGSSQVAPRGGVAAKVQIDKDHAEIFDPSSPLAAIRKQFPRAQVVWDDGRDVARAVKAAAAAEVAIVFADQWRTEGADVVGIALPNGQDRLIDAVARANPRAAVVLETGGPVAMPWLQRTAAVIEAWYPGQRGGEAIADILSGAANPSGRLPVTFPAALAQLPHPVLPGDLRLDGAPNAAGGRTFSAEYREGALVGYKWFVAKGERPLFPFGFGLSYTRFSLEDLSVKVEGVRVQAQATVRNVGDRVGAATPQFYVSLPAGAGAAPRLVGWQKVELQPGEARTVSVPLDPRLLASFDEAARRWRVAAGTYALSAGFDVERRQLSTPVTMGALELPP
jgi:beta-glucosidase